MTRAFPMVTMYCILFNTNTKYRIPYFPPNPPILKNHRFILLNIQKIFYI